MIHIVIPGKPLSKSNFKVKNKQGKYYMPKNGKGSEFKEYEELVQYCCLKAYKGDQIKERMAMILELYFPNNVCRDSHNYTKSICDGIEKSGIIENDNLIKPVIIFTHIDKENPRAEVKLYPSSEYKLKGSIRKKDERIKDNYIKIVVEGNPITKSNFKLSKTDGTVWMPMNGKHSKYAIYEQEIAWKSRLAHSGEPIEEEMIAVLNLFFKTKTKRDIHNYPKSICDGVEKGGVVKNDSQLKTMLLFEHIDKDNPRAEIELYPTTTYHLTYEIIKLATT